MAKTMIDPNEVEAAPAAPEEFAPAPMPESNLPDELLNIAAIQGILAGAPPAFSAKSKGAEKSDQGKLIIKHKSDLEDAGIRFYRSLSGDTAVIFNALQLNGEDLKAADKAGKLLQIAPPFEQVNSEIAKMGPDQHPSLNPKAVPGSPAGPTSPNPPQSAQFPMPANSGAATARLKAQLTNLKPQAPTAGARPGQGRLLNSILKPVL